MKILIGADIVPTNSNQKYFESGNMEQIIDDELLGIINGANYRIFNLEVPLTDTEAPIKKCGPNLIASTKAVSGFKQLSIDFLTLANNHILDQGEQGLWSTTDALEKAGIAYAGVGATPFDAAKPHIIQLGEKMVGIYCCAEHEFSIVTDTQPGANPFDPLESLDHIVALKEVCDYVICLYHGGKEHYRYPSPNLQKTCRKIVEKGADLVICQHTHCIGCEEKWLNGTIVYGQGNFLFDLSNSEYWQTSVLIQVDLDDNSVEYIPIQKDDKAVKLAQHENAEAILYEMRMRSEQIQQENFVKETYDSFAKTMIEGYLSRDVAMRKTILFRGLDRILGHRIGKWMMRRRLKKYRYLYINQYECEAHQELIIRGLN